MLFTSDEERRLARESFWLYQCNEKVVSYGTAAPEIDLELARREFFNSFPQLRDKQLLLFLGRLHEKKGCEILIEAFSALHHSAFHLVLAGPCADEKYLLQLKQIAATSPVTFAEMLSGNKKWGALSEIGRASCRERV